VIASVARGRKNRPSVVSLNFSGNGGAPADISGKGGVPTDDRDRESRADPRTVHNARECR